jgi:hypothetical protein
MKYQANLQRPARRKLRPGLPACAMLQAMVPSKEADTDPPNQIDIPSEEDGKMNIFVSYVSVTLRRRCTCW